jgi:uncharacterized protein with HEPN domain
MEIKLTRVQLTEAIESAERMAKYYDTLEIDKMKESITAKHNAMKERLLIGELTKQLALTNNK